MYLSKLTISGFRQFGQGDAAAELTFQPGVTALIGTNDSGKTAIIDAVFTGQVSAVQKKLHFAYDFCHQFSLCFRPQSLIVMTASFRNSFVRFSPVVSLLCCSKCYQRSVIKRCQVQPGRRRNDAGHKRFCD
jgi:ABC-type branched-subunit amino acid transport system ATPase component